MNAIPLGSQEFPSPAHTGLYLVRDQEYIFLRAKGSKLFYKSFVKRHNTAFSLNELNHYRTDGSVHFFFDIVNIPAFIIFFLAFFLIEKYKKLHPIVFIASGAVIGIAVGALM